MEFVHGRDQTYDEIKHTSSTEQTQEALLLRKTILDM